METKKQMRETDINKKTMGSKYSEDTLTVNIDAMDIAVGDCCLLRCGDT
jgi:hypothetical protein